MTDEETTPCDTCKHSCWSDEYSMQVCEKHGKACPLAFCRDYKRRGMTDEEAREEASKIIEEQMQQVLRCVWLDFYRDLAKDGDRLAAAFVEQTKTHPCFWCMHASAVFPRWPYHVGDKKVIGYVGCSHESKERTEVATERCELYRECRRAKND